MPAHKNQTRKLLGDLGSVAFDDPEEVFGLLPRILVAVHGGTDDLGTLLVQAEQAVDLVGGGVGVVALGGHDLEAQEALQIRLVDGLDKCLFALGKLAVALVFWTDLFGLLDTGGRNRDGGLAGRGDFKVALVGEEVVVVEVADLRGFVGLVAFVAAPFNCAVGVAAENVVVDVDGADAVHETEALAHVFEGLGAGPCEEDRVVVEVKGHLVEVFGPYGAGHLACCVTAGDEDVVVDFHVALAHQGGDTVVAAVDEDAVGDADVAFNVEVEGIFVTVGVADLDRSRGRAGLDETAGQDSFVRGAGALVVNVGAAVEVVFTEVEHEAVDDDVALRAGVAVGTPCVEVEQRGDEGVLDGLQFGDVFDDVALAEIGRVAAVDTDEFAHVFLLGGISETAAFDVAAVQVAVIIAFRNEDDVIFFGDVDGFLKIPKG